MTTRYTVLLAATLLVAGCSQPVDTRAYDPVARSEYRDKLFNECMNALPAGPQVTKYNDWDDVVSECSQSSYYRANERFRIQP